MAKLVWSRPTLGVRVRRAVMAGGVVAVAAAAGLVVAARGGPAPVIVTVPAVAPAVVPVAAPVVVPMPVPVAVPAPPAPERATPPDEAPPGPPRAVAPRLDAACIGPGVVDDDPACAWDDGFPAVSADGATVAIRAITSDDATGATGVSIRFHDVATARVREEVILAVDEASAAQDVDEASSAGVQRLRARIARRAAKVQRVLDAGGYRALVPLGSADEDGAVAADPAGVHAELAGESIRIVDPARGAVLWQARIAADPPRGAAASDDDMCPGWTLRGSTAWWDPATRTVLVTQRYDLGGCMCPTVEPVHVRRF